MSHHEHQGHGRGHHGHQEHLFSAALDDRQLNTPSPTPSLASVDETVYELFRDAESGLFEVPKFIEALKKCGIRLSDPRLREVVSKLREIGMEQGLPETDDEGHGAGYAQLSRLQLDRDAFKRTIMNSMVLVTKALQRQFVVPDWRTFTDHLTEIFIEVKKVSGGQNATYIPELARADPNYFGLSVCSVDGQRNSWGNSRVPFCIQSISKAFTYAINLNDLGPDMVHKHIGTEPSGRLFNEICLDSESWFIQRIHTDKPHNPMINAGAIVCASLIRKTLCVADRYNFVLDQYRKMSGGEYIGFSNATFLSERETADRNYALAYYMRENGNFDKGEDMRAVLEFYFQMCSIEITCESGAVLAATLANGGICPITGERCLSNLACRHTLSLMHSCGMYDYSGMFAFKVGLPAKSGVAGGLILVVPNVCGFCIYSPPLDRMGNTVKGVRFCEELVDRFSFHNYDNLAHAERTKVDPRKGVLEAHGQQVTHLLFAAKAGDLTAIRGYLVAGYDLNDADYDGRTALHVAASEGQTHVVKFLVEKWNCNAFSVDRWGHTALEDAQQFGFPECARVLERAVRKQSQTNPEAAAAAAAQAAAVHHSISVNMDGKDNGNNQYDASDPDRTPTKTERGILDRGGRGVGVSPSGD